MNKRGFWLAEETLKIILAVISIIFLVAFIVYLYNGYSQNKDLENAQSSLDYLISQVNSGYNTSQIYNPQGWMISSFPANSNLRILLMPRECSTVGWKSCICIYDPTSIGNPVTQGPIDAISFTGQCQQSDFVLKGQVQVYWKNILSFMPALNIGSGVFLQNSIEIYAPPVVLTIDQKNKVIQVSS